MTFTRRTYRVAIARSLSRERDFRARLSVEDELYPFEMHISHKYRPLLRKQTARTARLQRRKRRERK
ncbi:hypothetical protein GCM10010525_01490 [Glutamicibacter bergerei]|nr:hypothetical protein [Micrococcaceae bacterium]